MSQKLVPRGIILFLLAGVLMLPIAAAVARSKRLDPNGNLWQSVVECTGQPANMTSSGESPDRADETLLTSSHALV